MQMACTVKHFGVTQHVTKCFHTELGPAEAVHNLTALELNPFSLTTKVHVKFC